MADANSDNSLTQIVVAERPTRAGGISGIFGSGAKLPSSKLGMTMLRVSDAGGLRQFLPGNPEPGDKSVPDLVLFVRADPWPLMLTLPGAKTDPDGHSWDLALAGIWTITGAAQFVQQFAMGIISPNAPLDASEVQTWAMAQIEHRMRKQIDSLSLEALRDQKICSPRWWESHLNAWFAPLGLTPAITRMEMSSTTAAHAAERRKREQHEREVQAQRAAMREQELAEQAVEAEFEQRKAKIETDRQLAADQRAVQLEELQQQRRAHRDEGERVRLAAAQELERLRFNHEIEMAAIREKVAEEQIARQKEADAQFLESREQARLKQTGVLQALQAKRDRLAADAEANGYRVGAQKAEMDRKLAELDFAEKNAKTELSRQEVELNLKMAEAELRRKQIQAEHDKTLAAAEALSAARLAMLSRQEQTSNEQRARFAAEQGAQSQVLHKAKLHQILSDQTLSEDVRRIQIERETILLEATKRRVADEADAARVQAERDKALHDVNLNILRLKLTSLEQASGHEAGIAEKFAKYHAAMEIEFQKIPQTVAELLASDPRKAHQAAETITQEWHTPAASLQSLGYSVTAQALVDRWTCKAKADGNPVFLNKRELITRDIGVSSAKILKIGSTLHFYLSSSRAGYITVINLGTSGRFWLLCPGICSIPQSRVQPNRAYELPGHELFPYYVVPLTEEGPAGWEHLVAIVSNEPLIDDRWLCAAERPIAEIAETELQRLVAKLDKMPNDWSAGILSFQVE